MSRIETMGMHRVVVSSYILEHWAQSVKDDQRSDATARETIVRISERDDGSVTDGRLRCSKVLCSHRVAFDMNIILLVDQEHDLERVISRHSIAMPQRIFAHGTVISDVLTQRPSGLDAQVVPNEEG